MTSYAGLDQETLVGKIDHRNPCWVNPGSNQVGLFNSYVGFYRCVWPPWHTSKVTSVGWFLVRGCHGSFITQCSTLSAIWPCCHAPIVLNTRCVWAGGTFFRCLRKVPPAHLRSVCVLQELPRLVIHVNNKYISTDFLVQPKFSSRT